VLDKKDYLVIYYLYRDSQSTMKLSGNGKVKEKSLEAKNPQYAKLPVEERLHIFANLVIDRVLEEKAKLTLPDIKVSKKD